MKVFVVTFSYPGVQKWIPSYCDSVCAQTDQSFQVILFQDQCDFSSLFSSLGDRVKSVRFDSCASPYEVRLSALRYLKKHYQNDLLVFSDLDDLLTLDRIEKTKAFFSKSSLKLLASNMSTINEKGALTEASIWDDRLPKEFGCEEILTHNFVGFGNTAMLAEIIPENLDQYSFSVIAADWFFFYCLLKDKVFKGGATNDALVLYRQHDQNESGLSVLNESRLFHGVEVVLAQFKALDKKYSEVFYHEYTLKIEHLKDFIQNKNNRLNYLSKAQNNKQDHFFWWEDIKPLKELPL